MVLVCGWLASVQLPSARLYADDIVSETGNLEDVASVLERGRQFEQRDRWIEALSLYEDAAHHHPENSDVQRQRTLAHIHCDLQRRLEDPSYLQLVSSLSEPRAMQLYDELTYKIRSHFFDEPDWQRVVWRGTANLDIALTKPDFRTRFAPRANEDQFTAFRQLLRDDVNRRPIRTQLEARQLVAYAAHLAEQRLGSPLGAVVGEYCCGGIASLDQYSSYLTASQLDDVYSQIEGNFVGLGIELKSDDQSLLIVKVIPGGPAERSGVHAGDHITAVNGVATSLVSPEEAADMLKGEEHTMVRLALEGSDGVTRDVRVSRERVEVPSVEDARMLDPSSGTAYFRLTSFQKTTSQDVDAALWKLHREGMRVLVMDLRDNPGGLLTSSVEVADKFLREGVIVSTRGRSPREDFDYRAHDAGTWRVPLVVLINQNTASASEIFAGAIRDHGRGTIVGERSYGKGSVQGIFPLNSIRSGVRLTTSKFFSPSGQPISDRGVLPHRTVHVAARPADGGNPVDSQSLMDDPMVAAACETARHVVVASTAAN
ncbi:MAG TPA: S41 family peptidase [Pirellulaceae bacterium]